MFYPTYAWMFINWYFDNWWLIENSSCIMDGSVNINNLEQVLRASLTLDHFPRIEDEHVNEKNMGNIVSYFCSY